MIKKSLPMPAMRIDVVSKTTSPMIPAQVKNIENSGKSSHELNKVHIMSGMPTLNLYNLHLLQFKGVSILPI